MRKSIAITGAASGIGKATAEMFFSKGWYVGLFDINEKDLTSLFSKFDEKSACMRKMDVSDPESVKDVIHFFSEKTDGKMNVLFNCAGILQMGHHEKIPLKTQKKIVDVNLIGILNCIDASF
ncbi:MAG: short-chain dehydrogenase, partial [Desulfobacterium sp.]|nr:short-chain dehydrogenase [Desulfobacterium sp.]